MCRVPKKLKTYIPSSTCLVLRLADTSRCQRPETFSTLCQLYSVFNLANSFYRKYMYVSKPNALSFEIVIVSQPMYKIFLNQIAF